MHALRPRPHTDRTLAYQQGVVGLRTGLTAVRRVDKKDIRRIAKCTGAQVVLTMATMIGPCRLTSEGTVCLL